jgi:hypothetical protein
VKRVLGLLIGAAALVGAIVVLMDATQNRPDEVRAGSMTTVTFEVDTRDVQRGEPAAANALWAVCAGTVGGDVSLPVEVGDAWQVTIEPAIGEHGENRLVGCLEDVTIDRVMGHVVALEHGSGGGAS